jgi:hypothetical protein
MTVSHRPFHTAVGQEGLRPEREVRDDDQNLHHQLREAPGEELPPLGAFLYQCGRKIPTVRVMADPSERDRGQLDGEVRPTRRADVIQMGRAHTHREIGDRHGVQQVDELERDGFVGHGLRRSYTQVVDSGRRRSTHP